jgi:hypothetical protein
VKVCGHFLFEQNGVKFCSIEVMVCVFKPINIPLDALLFRLQHHFTSLSAQFGDSQREENG